MAKNYYDILGVSRDASDDTIKKAFRKLAHRYHPDKGGGDEQKFKEINEAYQVLSDKEKRRQYDTYGQTFSGAGGPGGFSPGGEGGFDFSQFDFGGSGFEDIFSDFFGGGARRGRRARAGSDIQVDVEIDFEEMVRGTKKEVTLRKLVRCHHCKGSGGEPGSKEERCGECQGSGAIRRTVRSLLGTFVQSVECNRCRGTGKTFSQKCRECAGEGRTKKDETITLQIPAGVQHGQILSVPGGGAAGEFGAPAGDLFIAVHIRPHMLLKRNGDDLVSTLDLSYAQAVLGDKVPVRTLDGTVTMTVPPGTQPGEVFRIKGKGIPHLGRFGRGDQLVKINLVIPKKLSSEMKRLIEALRTHESGP